MKFNDFFGKLIFAVVFVIAVALAGYGFWSFQRNLTVLDQASQENISWPAMRLEFDLMRFNGDLRSYRQDGPISPASMNQRFDVLWSKVYVFQQGRVGARLSRYAVENGSITSLFQEMQDRAPMIENIGALSDAELQELRDAFQPYAEDLRILTKVVFLGEQDILAGIHEQLRRSANTTLLLSLISVVILLIGLGVTSWQSRRFRKLADKNSLLAIEAQEASQAKTRFLTMMSHELRTPMNGVLGLLALLRQSTSESQVHIVDQAERSASQMITMLTDILEFSALQNDEMTLDNKNFELVQLADAINDLFGPEARRAGIGFSSAVVATDRIRLNGDFRRLKQISAHLAGYFVDLAGLKNVTLKFDYVESDLTVNIELDYGSDVAPWTPDLIFGERDNNDDSFMADALGPAVARGLIAKMSGEMSLVDSDQAAIVISVRIPMERVKISKVKIWLELTSAVMDSICRSSLRDTPVEFVTDQSDSNVNIVLFETGGMDEADRVAKMQAFFPNALIVAIGRPINAEQFDFAIPTPSQISDQLGAVIHDLAS